MRTTHQELHKASENLALKVKNSSMPKAMHSLNINHKEITAKVHHIFDPMNSKQRITAREALPCLELMHLLICLREIWLALIFNLPCQCAYKSFCFQRSRSVYKHCNLKEGPSIELIHPSQEDEKPPHSALPMTPPKSLLSHLQFQPQTNLQIHNNFLAICVWTNQMLLHIYIYIYFLYILLTLLKFLPTLGRTGIRHHFYF